MSTAYGGGADLGELDRWIERGEEVLALFDCALRSCQEENRSIALRTVLDLMSRLEHRSRGRGRARPGALRYLFERHRTWRLRACVRRPPGSQGELDGSDGDLEEGSGPCRKPSTRPVGAEEPDVAQLPSVERARRRIQRRYYDRPEVRRTLAGVILRRIASTPKTKERPTETA
jgi:hypothetical protein